MKHISQQEIIFNIKWSDIEFARITHAGQTWRLGACNPEWRETLADAWGTPAGVKGLSAQDIWVVSETSPVPDLIGMCCGLGSVWPGMGRELYAAFPVAAQAMDHIARLADWDILGLMDERSLDKISQTRWQIPYLFMLEYAQWRLLQALGAKASAFCGHSLGELIALCLAGVYSVESAWYLLETRAEHMAGLEAKSCRSEGMLAVPAGYPEIAPLLQKWPDLRISNRNTYKQYILGGDREHLLEARRHLRRKRIPAIMLNMDLAFHNPAMRILRSISFRRLTGLEMSPSCCPVYSCVDTMAYPGDKQAICSRIADLDENTVDWVKLTTALENRHPASVFLELGPQETLCGLNTELMPEKLCIPVDKKGHEAEAMRQACARLFAAGLLNTDAIRKLCALKNSPVSGKWYIPGQEDKPEADTLQDIDPEEQKIIMELIAEAAGCKISEVLPSMDLRRDLAVRSSHFPFLMLEAERRLKKPVILENLFNIITVADLIRFLSGTRENAAQVKPDEPRKLFLAARMPLQREVWDNAAGIRKMGLNPCGAPKNDTSAITALIYDDDLNPIIMNTLAMQGSRISNTLRKSEEHGSARPQLSDGAIIVLPPVTPDTFRQGVSSKFPDSINLHDFNGWLYIVQRFISSQEPTGEKEYIAAWLRDLQNLIADLEQKVRIIAVIENSVPSQNWNELSDMLALEINYGDVPLAIWTRQSENCLFPPYCPASPIFQDVIPVQECSGSADRSAFNGILHYSCFAAPQLCGHGVGARYSPLLGYEPPEPVANAAWLPVGEILSAIYKAAIITAPCFRPVGYTDVRIFRLPALAWGLTRECRVTAASRLSLHAEGVAARQSLVKIEAAAVSANGRKNGRWLPVADGRCILSAASAPVPAICDMTPSNAHLHDTVPLSEFYEMLGMSRAWRLIKELHFSANQISGIIKTEDSATGADIFSPPYIIMDCALLGAMAFLGYDGKDLANADQLLKQWQFVSIGFIRFETELIKSLSREDIYMEWRLSWQDSRLTRYDIQALVNDRVMMTIQNLEFDRILSESSCKNEF